MNKIYDKLLLAIAVLLLAGGVFLYLQKSDAVTSLNPSIDVQPADKPYLRETTSSLSPAEVNWPEASEQSTGWLYDVFTPPKIFIDENATPEQRDAIEKIVTGEDTEEMATMWWIFNAMCTQRHPTEYKKINTEIDVENRLGSVVVDGTLNIKAEPIKNPVTGAEHRARIDLPNGFEYKIAEMGSASTTTTAGKIALTNNTDSYAQFAELHLNNSGVVR